MENEDGLLKAMKSVYERDHTVTLTLTAKDIAIAEMYATHEDDLPKA
jgi:hypothetical protein